MLSTPPAFILSQDQTLMFKSWFFQNLAWLNFRIQSRRAVTVFGCVFFWKRCDSAFKSRSLNYSLTNLSRLFHCSVFNVLLFVLSCDSLFRLSHLSVAVKYFFEKFFILSIFFSNSVLVVAHLAQLFVCLTQYLSDSLDIIARKNISVNLFLTFFDIFLRAAYFFLFCLL